MTQPEGKPTVELETPPAWAVSIAKNVAAIRGNTEALAHQFDLLRTEVSSLQQWRLDEGRNPRHALTSIRVREVIDERASQMNLEQDARIAALLVQKDEKISKLEAESATKAEMKDMLAKAADAQTEAIVAGVKTVLSTPTAQRLKGALVPVLMIAISLIGLKLTAAVTKLEERPVVQLAPVTVHADAGEDK